MKRRVNEEFVVVEKDAKDAPVKDIVWQGKDVEVESQTKLEEDTGWGAPVIIRQFMFGVNPEAFNYHPPTKQELFNSHLKGIEIMLWKDGLKVWPDVPPRLIFTKKKDRYTIFVAATPAKGHQLRETPQTLTQIANASRTHKKLL